MTMSMPLGSIGAGDASQGAGKPIKVKIKNVPPGQKLKSDEKSDDGAGEAGDDESDETGSGSGGDEKSDDESDETGDDGEADIEIDYNDLDEEGRAKLFEDYKDEDDLDGSKTMQKVGSTQENFDKSTKDKVQHKQGTVTSALFDFSESTWKDNFVPYKKFGRYSGSANHYEARIAKSKQLVNYLFKQFETRRRAHEYTKTQPSKRGGLNLDTMYRYQFSDDIFARKELVQQTKNHGLVVLIDFSGSMTGQIEEVLMLTMDLVTFCQKAAIKLSVLGFCDGPVIADGKEQRPSRKSKQSTDYYFNPSYKLIELFSHTMKRAEVVNAANWITASSKNQTGWGAPKSYATNSFALGGTPLNDALVQMPSYINDFRAANGIEIVNFVCISDGDSNALRLGSSSIGYYGATGSELMITDKASKNTIIRRDAVGYSTTESLLTVIRKICKVKTGCFYLCNNAGASEAQGIIRPRDNSHDLQPVPGTSVYQNAMGYDYLSFIPTHSVGRADVGSIIKNLKMFVDVIS
jgi:hypothetical protein